MRYSEFVNSIKQVRGVDETASYYGHTIDVTSDGVFVDDKRFNTLEEAREYIVSKTDTDDITKEIYEEVLRDKMITIISETHNIRVTNTILEEYLSLASSKVFTIDEAVLKIREANKLDGVLLESFDYLLEDGSKIIISKKMQNRLNSLLEDQEVIDYMRSSKENFFDVIDQVIGEY